jgi:predicted ATP-binding protein involved in virulence
MIIKSIKLENFRSQAQVQIELGRRVTILIGENGSGKTSFLDGLAIGLGAILTYLPGVSGISFKKTDIRQTQNEKSPYTRVRIETEEGIVWDRTERRDKSKATSNQIPIAEGLQQLRQYLDREILDPLNEQKSFQLPIFSYYGVHRALLEVPLRKRGFPKAHARFEALEGALVADTRFKSAFIWFYNKENEERRKQKEQLDFGFQLPELQAVRQALESVFPGVSEPHIQLNPLKFAVKREAEILDIMQLSDGYKTLLSLVIDLAIRMALANPDSKKPLETEAVVLIDEIDLHLHPDWQRKVLGDLLRTFPGTQFLLTTHSPFIVETINNHLQRFKVMNVTGGAGELAGIEPLDPGHVRAYFIKNNEIQSLLDREIQLIDDELIHPFNTIAKEYEQLRDLEWEAKTDV